MSFLENNFFLLAVTFGVFFFAKLLQKKTGLVLLNPILLTIAVLIIFLKMANISYETYNQGGHLIEFWLRPAVVALGVPLYLQLEMIKKQLLPILLSQLAGCIVGVISVVLIAKFMGASQEVILSLAPKSVTTPIAMEVTNKAVMEALDGLPPVKVHCSLLAEEAIHAALWDYAQKNGIEITRLKPPKSDIHEGAEEGEEY